MTDPGIAAALARLATLPRVLAAQKFADARDWHDPRLRLILKHIVGTDSRGLPQDTIAHYRARTWEFAAVVDRLAQAGLLDGSRSGVSFGSGRECLLYALSHVVQRLAATDLYDGASSWMRDMGASTARDYVLAGATLPARESALEVHDADMRDTGLPGGEFDFAYSVCAFEHIGHDAEFLQHLREAHRLTTDDGVYVLTTEINLEDRTHPIETNYTFGLSHFFDLCRQSGWCPAPVFDGALARDAVNLAVDIEWALHHDPAAAVVRNSVVREYGGVMSAPGVFVLRKQPYAPPRIDNLDATRHWLRSDFEARARLRYSQWVQLNAFGFFGSNWSPASVLAPAPQHDPAANLLFATAYMSLSPGDIECRTVLVAKAEADTDSQHPSAEVELAEVELVVHQWAVDDVDDLGPIYHEVITLPRGGDAVADRSFRFTCLPRHSYSILARSLHGDRIAVVAAEVQVRNA